MDDLVGGPGSPERGRAALHRHQPIWLLEDLLERLDELGSLESTRIEHVRGPGVHDRRAQ